MIELKKEWDNPKQDEKKVLKDFKNNLYKNLIIECGTVEKDLSFTFGFPYTSSSDFAAIWNTNTQTKLKNTGLYFRGLAIDQDGDTVAVFDEDTPDGEQSYFINISKPTPTSQKILYVEGAGCAYYGGINCRLRTAFTTNEGQKIYFECWTAHQYEKHKPISDYIVVDFAGYIRDDNELDYNTPLGRTSLPDVPYNATNILKVINKNFKTNFIKIEVIEHPFGTYYVHKDGGGYNMGDEYQRDRKAEQQRHAIYNYFYDYEKNVLNKKYPNFGMVNKGHKTTVSVYYNCYTHKYEIENIFNFNFNYVEPDEDTLKQARQSHGVFSNKKVVQ